MKLVTAIIKPHKLGDVKQALQDLGIAGMTVGEVKGFGRQRGHTEVYRGTEYQVDLVPKIKVEVVIDTADLDRVVKGLADAARTGSVGDGKLWVCDLDYVTRIRTGEIGPDAV